MVTTNAALFSGGVDEFIRIAPASSLTAHLQREFSRRLGTPSPAEVESWRRSLAALARVVAGTELDSSGVGVEVRLPFTSQRIDVAFVARDPDARPTVVVTELKQWDSVDLSDFPGNVVVGGMEMLHPSVQAGAYVEYLRESHSAFTEDGFRIQGCAYLHNMTARSGVPLMHPKYATVTNATPVFTRATEGEFQNFLLDRLIGGDGLNLLPKFVAGRYRPSLNLIQAIGRSLQDSPVWTLLDEQRLAFNTVLGLVEKAAATGQKAAVIITGGPGTGKSVIAAHLVIAIQKDGRFTAAHSTASKAFTTNLRALGGPATNAVFRWNMDFAHRKVEADCVDVLVVDEAHRIRESSNTRFTPSHLKSSIPQASELVRAARVSVFLLDEKQGVRPDEVGTVASIQEAASDRGVQVHRINLDAQFRCNGCTPYIEWVEELFSDEPAPVGHWHASGGYDFRVFDEVQRMEEEVRRLSNSGSTARLVAGFCWPWSDPLPGGVLIPDVQIGNWNRPWNEKSREQTRKKGATPKPDQHPYYLWATRPERIGEIGCIYSAQGFEFDYCGVILGPDLVWRTPHGWVDDKKASCDSGLNRKRWAEGELKTRLQQIYRVLLTRGIKGTFVYSTDAETRRLLHSLVPSSGST